MIGIIKAHKKKIIAIMLPLFLILIFLWCLRYHTAGTIRFVVKTIWGPEINIEKVDFSKGKITATNIEMIYKDEQILKCPKVEAFYTAASLKKLRLDTVIAYDPYAVTYRDRLDINFAVAFNGSKNEKAEKEEMEMPKTEIAREIYLRKKAEKEAKERLKKAGAKVPINKIIVNNGKVRYVDKTFRDDVVATIGNINGYITFDRKKGMYIEVSGSEKDETYKYLFSNEKERYWMHILVNNVVPKKEWIQYGYQGNDIAIWGGKIDTDMTIGSDSGLGGWVQCKELSGRYVNFDRDASDVTGKVIFPGGKKVECQATANILGNQEAVTFSYDGKGKFVMDASMHDISGIDINQYITLKEKNIDLKDLKVISPKMHLLYDSKADPKLIMDMTSDKILYKDNIYLDKASAVITRSAQRKVEIKDIKGVLQVIDPDTQQIKLSSDINIDYKYSKDKGEFDFNTSLDKKNNFLPPLNGKFIYDFTDNSTKYSIDSNVLKCDIDYFPGLQKLIARKEGKFTLEYDLKEKMLKKGSGVLEVDLGYALMQLDFIARDNVFTFDNTLIRSNMLPTPLPKDDAAIQDEETSSQDDEKDKEINDENDTSDNDSEYAGPSEYDDGDGTDISEEEEDQAEKEIETEEIWKIKEDASKDIVVNGTYDMNKNTMDISFEADDFYIERSINDQMGKAKATFRGSIKKSENDKVPKLDMAIKGLSAEYIGALYKLNGLLKGELGDDPIYEFSGEAEGIAFKDRALYGLKISGAYAHDKVNIIDLKNQLFSVNGTIDLKNRSQDIDFSISGLSQDKFGIQYPQVYITDAKGKIKGTFDDLTGGIDVNDADVTLFKDQLILLKGHIDIAKSKITAKNFFINDSILTGSYDLKTQEYSGKINIIEDDLTSYYTTSSFRHRLIGTIAVKGKGKKIDVTTKATLDRAYFNVNKLPSLYLDATYKSDTLTDGIVKVNKIAVQNNAAKDLISGSGSVDLKKKDVNIKINNSKMKVADLEEFSKRKDASGEISFNGNIEGNFDSLKYALKGSSNIISAVGMKFNNFLLDISGDLNEAKLNEFSFKYLQNMLKVTGSKSIKKEDYLFHITASNIKLDFLNVFFEKNNMRNISGMSTIDLTLRNTSNNGYMTLNNFSMDIDKYYLKLKSFNSRLVLDKKALLIEKFSGILNDGNTNITGKVNNVTLDSITSPNFMEDLDYDLFLKMKNVNYQYANNFNIICNSDLNLKSNKLKGNFEIVEGKVVSIPVDYISIYQIIANFLFRSTSKVASASRELGSDFAVDATFENALEMDLNFNVKNGVVLDIVDVNAFVGDIKGVVMAKGNIRGKGTELVLLGDAEVRDGSLTLNENPFTLERAIVSFTNKNDFLPNINPTINVEANVDADGENIKVGINGEMKRLRFSISSQNGGSSGYLSTLLSGGANYQDATTAKFVRMILNDQLSQTFFRPITRRIKRMFGLSKFRIKSNIMNTKKNTGSNRDDETELKFGAILEAENELYKDKLFWVASVTLIDGNTGQRNNGDEKNNTLNEYDMSVEYRFKSGRSIGVGAGRVPNYKRKNNGEGSNKSRNAVNYHIDFKFEKKYDSLFDILTK